MPLFSAARRQLEPRTERTLHLSDRRLALGAGGRVDRGVEVDDRANGERVREERERHAEELQRLGGEHRRVVRDLTHDGLRVHHGVVVRSHSHALSERPVGA